MEDILISLETFGRLPSYDPAEFPEESQTAAVFMVLLNWMDSNCDFTIDANALPWELAAALIQTRAARIQWRNTQNG